jgi:amino acid adenylation domain-containing protein/thioester reductase-like protein
MDLSENLHQLFRRQAAATPDAPAVVDDVHRLTYRQLDRLTDAMAGYFQKAGVHFDVPVGIFMETCADYVLPYIAALKAGGAYMPLDPAYPRPLLQKILLEAEPAVVVTKAAYLERLDFAHSAEVLCIDRDSTWRLGSYSARRVSAQTLDHLAFVAYSSGTTGEPKGIQNPHRGAVHSYLRRYAISDYRVGDRVACNIFFVWEVLRPLLRGATVVVIPDDTIYDPKLMVRFLSAHRITETLMTPSLLEAVLNAIPAERLQSDLAGLRVLWLNGEVVTRTLRDRAVAALPAGTRILNTYSISECHDVATSDLRRMGADASEFCPVGVANPDVVARLFNDRLEPVTDGPGELLIGGPCLARGYLKKPALTAERFVTIAGSRYYRTGDMARLLSDGRIEILGRCDDMVKIRGYSINLGAVESALRKLSSVHSCTVITEGAEGRDKRLVAYVVPAAAARWSVDAESGACPALREALGATLPAYSIPSVFVTLDAIPLNPVTGKADRKALPAPPRRTSVPPDLPVLPEDAGANERRAVMLGIWHRMLGLAPGSMGPDDNFFDYGGHSLLAVELTVAVERVFGPSLPAKTVYSHPTVNGLLAFMADRRPADKPRPPSLAAEARLEPAIIEQITKTDTGTFPVLPEVRSVLVTGATGFLGAFLLRQLIDTTPADLRIVCLVRPKNDLAPEARIRTNLQYYGLWGSDIAARVTTIAGDLTRPQLDLDDAQWRHLADTVGMIFHCASLVNYVYPYAVIKPHTVDGTREVLRLATQAHVKPVFYVSTNGIFPTEQGAAFPEGPRIDAYADDLTTGYAQAKWVAEKMIWQAVAQGLPACVLRPGNIGHHSDTGAANPHDFQTMLINACARTRLAPQTDDWHFEMTPVDYLSRAIVRLASDPDCFNSAYNAVAADRIPAETIFRQMRAKGLIDAVVPLKAWRREVTDHARKAEDPSLQLMAQSLSDLTLYLADESTYDCRRFEAVVRARGLQRPPVDAGYFNKLFAAMAA